MPITSLEIIERLSATPGRLDKEQIIFDAFMQGNREFFVGACLAYDPLITFGVKKVALIEEEDDGNPGTFTFKQFLDLANKLRARELTGHAARDAINDAALSSNISVWNGFYRRILLKDLKIGIEDKTINKILGKIGLEAKDYLIPIFGCQLAMDGADEKHAKKLVGKKYLDIKLDGVRLLSFLDKTTAVTQYTRNGKQNENFTEIVAALELVKKELPASFVLDGEVVSTSFQDLMTQIGRKGSTKDTSSARLALFDMIPLRDFNSGKCDISQADRHKLLAEIAPLLQEKTNGLVYVVPKVPVDLDTPEGQDDFKNFNKEAIEAGYEGVMIKDPRAPYETKRTASWLKVKPWIEVSLEVVDFERGDANGKYKDTLGALVCKGEDDGKLIETNVGSGLSDDIRKIIWADPEAYRGMIVEVRADAMTLERGATVYSLRFPRFKGWRGTVKGEKL